MNNFFKILFLAIFYIDAISGSNRCSLSDNECMRRGAMATYPIFMKGIENVVDPSDPLMLDSISADSGGLTYKLQNAKLTGMKDCETTTLILNEGDRSFQYNLECPQLELTADYTLSGQLGDVASEGTGPMKMIAEKYVFKFNGIYDKNTGKDEKEHVTIKTYTLDHDAKGQLSYELNNLKENSDAIHKYFNNNWKNKELLTPMNEFIKLFIEHLNTFLGLVPADQVFSNLS